MAYDWNAYFSPETYPIRYWNADAGERVIQQIVLPWVLGEVNLGGGAVVWRPHWWWDEGAGPEGKDILQKKLIGLLSCNELENIAIREGVTPLPTADYSDTYDSSYVATGRSAHYIEITRLGAVGPVEAAEDNYGEINLGGAINKTDTKATYNLGEDKRYIIEISVGGALATAEFKYSYDGGTRFFWGNRIYPASGHHELPQGVIFDFNNGMASPPLTMQLGDRWEIPCHGHGLTEGNQLTFTAKGKNTGTTQAEVLKYFVTEILGETLSDVVHIPAYNRAAKICEDRGLKAGGFLDERKTRWQIVNEIMAGTGLVPTRGMDGKLTFAYEFDDITPPVAVIPNHECSVTVESSVRATINNLPVLFGHDRVAGEHAGILPGAEYAYLTAYDSHQDDISINNYGARGPEETLELPFVSHVFTAKDCQKKYVEKYKKPPLVLRVTDHTFKRRWVRPGMYIAICTRDIYDRKGNPYWYQIMHVRGIIPDRAGGMVQFVCLDTGRYLTENDPIIGEMIIGEFIIGGVRRGTHDPVFSGLFTTMAGESMGMMDGEIDTTMEDESK